MIKGILDGKRDYPILAAVSAGLYPLVFFYSKNFTLIDSWAHLGYLVSLFLVVPILVVFVLFKIFRKAKSSWVKYLLPFLNLALFFFFLKIILIAGPQRKIGLLLLIAAAVLAYFFYRYFGKWMVFQLLLAAIGLAALVPKAIANLNYDKSWMQQPDAILDCEFKHKPNIYYIQPDGYVNFSEINKGYYQFDNRKFQDFLANNGFKSYPDFRSNYDATLASNAATFSMKHHFYSADAGAGEIAGARNIIMGNNPVLKILKRNSYQTYFLAEHPYLMMNRPKLGYDYTNFNFSDLPFIGTGMETQKEILPDIKRILLAEKGLEPKFFFIEIFQPKHIDGSGMGENLVQKKRAEYFENLKQANQTLERLIDTILKNDPDALILIMADHGGYVGMERFQDGNVKTTDPLKIYSMFSSILSVRWPKELKPEFDSKLKTPVNTFRILFSALSETNSYLEHLQEDASYGLIFKGAARGVYKMIDREYHPVFEKVKSID
jgi:hypothetical protein